MSFSQFLGNMIFGIKLDIRITVVTNLCVTRICCQSRTSVVLCNVSWGEMSLRVRPHSSTGPGVQAGCILDSWRFKATFFQRQNWAVLWPFETQDHGNQEFLLWSLENTGAAEEKPGWIQLHSSKTVSLLLRSRPDSGRCWTRRSTESPGGDSPRGFGSGSVAVMVCEYLQTGSGGFGRRASRCSRNWW